MNKFKIFYNKNRKKIWRTIIIIMCVIGLLRFSNYIYVQNKSSRVKTTTNSTKKTTQMSANSTYSTTKSSVTGNKVSKENLNNAQDVLDKFYGYCNNKELENAYNLLSNDCKEQVYPTLEDFTEKYYNYFFEGKTKIYSFKNWVDNVYYVTTKDDIMSTGKVYSDNYKNDYITIAEDKLNINSYIGKSEINKEKSENNLTINITSKQTFMDYEIYNFTVKNESDKAICLALGKSSKEIYLKDKNNVKYYYYNDDIVANDMIVNAGSSKEFRLKFDSKYVSTKKIETLIFNNIKTNKNEELSFEIAL